MILGAGSWGEQHRRGRQRRHHRGSRPRHRPRTRDPRDEQLRRCRLPFRVVRKGLGTCPPLPRRLARRRSSRSAKGPAGVDTCPIPALCWRALGCSHELRHVSGQPRPCGTPGQNAIRGRGRFPAGTTPGCSCSCGPICFSGERMAAGVHGNNALDHSPKRVPLPLPSYHSHCLCCCRFLARWASPRRWFSICVWINHDFSHQWKYE